MRVDGVNEFADKSWNSDHLLFVCACVSYFFQVNLKELRKLRKKARKE